MTLCEQLFACRQPQPFGRPAGAFLSVPEGPSGAAWPQTAHLLVYAPFAQYSPRYVAAAALSLAVDHLRENKKVEVELPTLYSSFSVQGTALAMPDSRERAAQTFAPGWLCAEHSRTGAPCCRLPNKVCSR
jgi:hypothetical protein